MQRNTALSLQIWEDLLASHIERSIKESRHHKYLKELLVLHTLVENRFSIFHPSGSLPINNYSKISIYCFLIQSFLYFQLYRTAVGSAGSWYGQLHSAPTCYNFSDITVTFPWSLLPLYQSNFSPCLEQYSVWWSYFYSIFLSLTLSLGTGTIYFQPCCLTATLCNVDFEIQVWIHVSWTASDKESCHMLLYAYCQVNVPLQCAMRYLQQVCHVC
jgi:hypothetical protein